MAGRMPVLRHDDMVEFADQPVHDRHDRVAAGNGQRAAGAEIVLQIDHHQRFHARSPSVLFGDRDSPEHGVAVNDPVRADRDDFDKRDSIGIICIRMKMRSVSRKPAEG